MAPDHLDKTTGQQKHLNEIRYTSKNTPKLSPSVGRKV